MKSTFDLQDELYGYFVTDLEMLGLLDLADGSDVELCDTKIRRSFQDPTKVTPEALDFFDYSFIDTRKSGNYLVNLGLLEFNVYTSNRYRSSLLYKCIKRIIQENYEDMEVYSEGQVGCPIENIYCYRIRVKPLVSS